MGGLLLCLFGACGGETPSDEEMLETFQEQRRTFETLRRMFEADTTLELVNENSVVPNRAITSDRAVQYRQLMDRAGVSSAKAVRHSREGKSTFFFTAYTIGLSISGRSKGYSYDPVRPDSIVDNLTRFERRIDSLRDQGQKIFAPFVYRHIEGNWYLYFTDP